MQKSTRIWTTIDFEEDGKQSDFLRLPYSSNSSAYGWIPIPIICVKNGSGPTAVLLAGSHGDEYEGQVALLNLARSLQAEDISGRVIIIPAINAPAARNGSRLSPLDDGNLNRLYPGDPHGTSTQMIAHYVVDVLLAISTLIVDLHSGGHSLEFEPCAIVRPYADKRRQELVLELLHAFGAPVSIFSTGKGGGGDTTLAAAADEAGVINVTAELGGGATLSPVGLGLAEAAVRRMLYGLRITKTRGAPPPSPTRFMEVPGVDYFVYSLTDGIFEPLANVGDEVSAGQPAGRVHSLSAPIKSPETITFEKDGVVSCRRFDALTATGDCLFGLVREIPNSPSVRES